MPKILLITGLVLTILLTGFIGLSKLMSNLMPHHVLVYKKISEGLALFDTDLRLRVWLLDEKSINGAPPLNWSPDGKSIAYVANHEGGVIPNWDIYLLSLDDMQVRNLTHSPTQEFFWQWSPDGKQIAYTAQTRGEGITVIGTELQVMDMATGANIPFLSRTGYRVYSPTWSPDGRLLAFVYQAYESSNNSAEMQIIDTLSGKILVTFAQNFDLQFGWGLAWSPDQKWLAYKYKNEQEIGLHLLEVATGRTRQLFSPLDVTASQPAWAPDSQQLAFVNPEDRVVVRIVNLKTWEVRKVFQENVQSLPTDESNYPPVWSPDGQWLAFVAPIEGMIYGIRQSDGHYTALLSPNSYIDRDSIVGWLPDSQSLLFTDGLHIYSVNISNFRITPLMDDYFISNPILQPG